MNTLEFLVCVESYQVLAILSSICIWQVGWSWALSQMATVPTSHRDMVCALGPTCFPLVNSWPRSLSAFEFVTLGENFKFRQSPLLQLFKQG
jgi:hypothetical protein